MHKKHEYCKNCTYSPHLNSSFIKIIEQQTSGIQVNSGGFDQRMALSSNSARTQ
jgi:hypothetical protein